VKIAIEFGSAVSSLLNPPPKGGRQDSFNNYDLNFKGFHCNRFGAMKFPKSFPPSTDGRGTKGEDWDK
jgi:hypothetical protein